MKKLICLFLAMAVVFALITGCSTDKYIGQTDPTTATVNQADLQNALGSLDGAMDAAVQEAMRKAMEQGVTIPPDTGPLETAPPPMPSGVQASPTELRPLMEKIYKIFNSGTFLIKAKGSSPMGGPTGQAQGTTPMTIAVDKDNTMMEFDMDWITMLKAASEGTPNFGMATINGAIMITTFGKKVRFVSTPGNGFVAFLDKKTYIPMGAFSEEGESAAPVDMAGTFSGSFLPKEGLPQEIKSSKVTMGGKEYLCATLDDGNARYYFQGGDLKRIEIQNTEDIMILEIEALSGTVDPKLFSSEGFRAVPIDQLTSLGDNFGSLF